MTKIHQQCFFYSLWKLKQETKQKQDKNKIKHTKNKANIKTERQKHETCNKNKNNWHKMKATWVSKIERNKQTERKRQEKER